MNDTIEFDSLDHTIEKDELHHQQDDPEANEHNSADYNSIRRAQELEHNLKDLEQDRNNALANSSDSWISPTFSGNEEDCDDRYETGELIRTGPTEDIYFCAHRTTDETCISKTIQLQDVHWINGEPIEVKIMREVSHPNISRVLDWFKNDKVVVIVMPYTGGINLHDFQDQMGSFSESYIKEQAVKLLSAMKCLHDNGFVHQNIKPSNVLVNPANGDLTLINFGRARTYNKYAPWEHKFKCTQGTPGFSPPEFDHRQRVWGPEVDVHCFAATIFYMFYGVCPSDDVELVSEAWGKRIPSFKMTKLLFSCLDSNAFRRPTVDDIIKSDWLRDVAMSQSPVTTSECFEEYVE